MRLRPAVAWGPRVPIDDICAILDVAEGFPDDASIRILSPHNDGEDGHDGPDAEQHPWSVDWTGVAVCVHGAAVLVPIVGEWPFGAHRHADDMDPADLKIADLIAPLRQVVLRKRDERDQSQRFADHDASMQRTVDLMMAHAQTDHAGTVTECDEYGEGTVMCEMGMDEHGLPFMFMESSTDNHDVDIDHRKRLAIARIEPLCMMACASDMTIGGERLSTVLLTPTLNDASMETLEGTVHDPMTVIRILHDHAEALAATGIPAYDDEQEQDA